MNQGKLDRLRAIAVFAMVCDNKSFSKTGKQLNITASAVSQQIKFLEKELDTVLLLRSTRKLSLTKQGEMLLLSARKILEAVDEVNGSLQGNYKQLIRVGSTPVFAPQIFKALNECAEKSDDFNVELVTTSSDEQNVCMIDQQIDLSVEVTNKVGKNDIILMPVDMVVVCSPEYEKKYGTIDLNNRTKNSGTIISNDGAGVLKIRTEDSHYSIQFANRIICKNEINMIDLAVKGIGVLKINRLAVADQLKSGKLVLAYKDKPLNSYHLVCRRTKMSKGKNIELCIKQIKKIFSKTA